MEKRVEIVSADVEDLAGISRLAGEIWRAVYPGIISVEQIEYMLAWMYDVDAMRREIASGVRFLRVIVDGADAGFAAWGPAMESGVCKLHKLYLQPSAQGKGLGKMMLEHVMRDAREAGFGEIVLNVNKKNLRAIAMYQRNKFSVCAEVRDDIGGGFVMDDYIMGRRL